MKMSGNFIDWNDAAEIVWLAEQQSRIKQHLKTGFTDTYMLDTGSQHQMIIIDAASQQAISYSIA